MSEDWIDGFMTYSSQNYEKKVITVFEGYSHLKFE
jgi:hypothetical protein